MGQECLGPVDMNIISRRKHGTDLVAAIESGSLEYVNKLLGLENDPNVFAEGQEAPVYIAVKKGGLDIVRTLVDYGADTSYTGQQDSLGMAAPMYALNHRYESHIKELLDAGASLHIKDIRGRDTLYWTALQAQL